MIVHGMISQVQTNWWGVGEEPVFSITMVARVEFSNFCWPTANKFF
jgi:hypothetical protein